MSVDIFIDTNILVYSFDNTDPEKHVLAKRRLDELWENQQPIALSIQVLQEFYVTMIRKGGDPSFFREVVEHYMRRRIIENTCGLMQLAMDVHHRYGTSFYDASIIAAAQMSGARELWSEDFNTGQDYGGVVAVNPLIGEL
ncbi:MAG: PIN domain-containing protein [Verrucomicrobiota bacterium]